MTESLDRTRLVTLCAAAFASMAAMRLCDPLLPAFVSSFGVTTGEAARTVSSFAIMYGLLQLVFGPLGDRFGKFRVIALAVCACVVGNIAAVLANDLDALILARALAGATAGGIIPLSLAWVGDAVPYERRQAVLGQLMVATLLGTAFGQWISGTFADTVGWRWAFALVAVLFAAIGITMLRLARDAVEHRSADGQASYASKVAQVLRQRWARWILALTLIEGACAFSAMSFVPAHLHARFGLSFSHAAAITALLAAGGLVYALQARRMVSVFGEKGLALVGAALLGLCFAWLAWMPQWSHAVPACMVAGLGFTMLHATLQTHATQMAPTVRGTATALFGACIFLGQSMGILLAAALIDRYGFDPVFLVAGAVLVLLGAAFAWSLPSSRQTA
jgi:MFS transporter, YNFM family, putative membrane transport protein